MCTAMGMSGSGVFFGDSANLRRDNDDKPHDLAMPDFQTNPSVVRSRHRDSPMVHRPLSLEVLCGSIHQLSIVLQGTDRKALSNDQYVILPIVDPMCIP